MEFTFVNVVTFLLLVNALFWGLGSHTQHCKLIEKTGLECMSHNIHLTMGLFFFVCTMVLVHRKYLSQYWSALDF